MEYKWHIKTPAGEEEQTAKSLAKELKISYQSALLLVYRGLTTADAARTYIRPSLSQLHDPFLMKDMDKAVERLSKAIERNERILVYGDYDVDGTTAVAVVYTILSRITDNLDFYIPDRYNEGYGISFKGIDYAKENGFSLIIALDCGIKAVDKIDYANRLGIDFIICDHHTPGSTIPDAKAVLNMKRADCPYPFKDLSGCGVGYKFMQAFIRHSHHDEAVLTEVLPLLAMSIASDIVSMTDENRILAYYGIRQINTHPSIGLKSLMQIAGMQEGKVTITDLVFKIGPRINASGRMFSGAEAVRLLITNDSEYAAEKAKEIDDYNKERRTFDSQTKDEALALLEADPDNQNKHTTVVYSPTWHKGVVGIAASRLTETYYRPTIVFTKGDPQSDIISGSARSVSNFDIYSAIDSCHDLLTNFGGHAFAAGLSLKEKDLPEFKRRFEEYVSQHIQPEQQQPTIQIEQEIEFADITPQFFKILCCLEPYGPGNPRPIFVTRDVINNRYTKAVGEGKHLKLDVTDRTAAISGIAFDKGDLAMHLQNGNAIDVCYELDENTYNGVTTIQMKVQDIRIPEK